MQRVTLLAARSAATILGASANHKVGALQHILQVQIPDWMSEPRDAQHPHLPPALHLTSPPTLMFYTVQQGTQQGI